MIFLSFLKMKTCVLKTLFSSWDFVFFPRRPPFVFLCSGIGLWEGSIFPPQTWSLQAESWLKMREAFPFSEDLCCGSQQGIPAFAQFKLLVQFHVDESENSGTVFGCFCFLQNPFSTFLLHLWSLNPLSASQYGTRDSRFSGGKLVPERELIGRDVLNIDSHPETVFLFSHFCCCFSL